MTGAILGGIVYAASSGNSFNGNDLAIAMGTGLVAGALIGTGVGMGAGIAAAATIGAGAGALGSQVGYTLSAGSNYDSGEMIIAAGAGAAVGAVTGAIGAEGSALAGGYADALVEMGATGLGNTAQYAATEMYNGSTPTIQGAIDAFSSGAMVGGVSAIFRVGFPGNKPQLGQSVLSNPQASPSLKNVARRLVNYRNLLSASKGIANNAILYQIYDELE